MKSLRLSFTRKVGDHGILYGSVTSMDIVEALKERGYEIDRRRITLRDAIKETGEFTVPVRLHREVTVEVPVEVMAEGAAKAENASPAPTTQSGETTEEATAESAEA
jgi:large subunit ribosomal protein L9